MLCAQPILLARVDAEMSSVRLLLVTNLHRFLAPQSRSQKGIAIALTEMGNAYVHALAGRRALTGLRETINLIGFPAEILPQWSRKETKQTPKDKKNYEWSMWRRDCIHPAPQLEPAPWLPPLADLHSAMLRLGCIRIPLEPCTRRRLVLMRRPAPIDGQDLTADEIRIVRRQEDHRSNQVFGPERLTYALVLDDLLDAFLRHRVELAHGDDRARRYGVHRDAVNTDLLG